MFEIIDTLKKQGIKPSNTEKNKQLIGNLRQGNLRQATNVDEFILSNVHLVAYCVKAFLRRSPDSKYLIDDLFSEGLLALLQSPRFLIKSKVASVQSYLCKCIFNRFNRLMDNEKLHANNMSFVIEKHDIPISGPHQEIAFLKDMESFVTRAGLTMWCIRLRMWGYSLEEVAKQSNCSTSAIFRRLKHLENLLREAYAD